VAREFLGQAERLLGLLLGRAFEFFAQLHSSPAQSGRQAAEWVGGALQGPTLRLPPPGHPAYSSVSVNEQVARSLGLTLPSETELEKRLGGER
jgi:ABC-type uncharacterized transport system substrate-binding protein